MAEKTLEIGVVIAGAGARGAYEAGLLAGLLPEIAARTQAEGQVARFWFIGTSAGSLNSVLIASRAPRVVPEQEPAEVRELWTATMDQVADIWGNVSEGRVLGLLPNGRLMAALTRLLPAGRLPLTSLLNTDPLHQLAQDRSIVDWEQLHRNVRDCTVGAVGAATTARDGRTVLFLHRHDGPPIPRDAWRDIDYVDCPRGIEAQHVLASSAIPVAFPAQRITEPPEWEGWYYDGGVRLNTPLKPAIELGLRHLVIVGTHPDRYDRDELPDPELPCPEVDEAAVPVANQIMADQLIQDLQTLRSRNRVQPQEATKYLFAGPATFDALADLARNTPTHWTLAQQARKLLGAQARDELSSYLLFDPGYLSASVEAGRIRAQEARVLGEGTPVVDWSS
ncbi:MAG: patatin-like phospholipase family protein [Candidatus Nanopelagicales bacterium]